METTFNSITSKLEDSVSNLQSLRKKTIEYFNVILIVSYLPVFFIELAKGYMVSATTIIIVLFFLVTSTLLLNCKKYPLAFKITIIIIPIIGFLFSFSPEAPIVAIFGQHCIVLGILLLAIPDKSVRYIFWLLYVIGLSCIYYFVVSKSDFIGPIFATTCLSYLFLLYSNFLNSQNDLLSEAVDEQRNTNTKILALNNELSEKNNEMKTFHYMLSHDLKGPLQTVHAFSNLLKNKVAIQGKEEQYLNFIEDSAHQMQILIDELLLLHKVENEAISFEPCDLNEIVKEVIKYFRHDIADNKVDIHISNLPVIKCNKTLIVALLKNLISNAIKFQPKDKPNHFPVIKIWHEVDVINEQEWIYLSDNGVGIDASYMEKIFEPFKRFYNQLEYKGTGLGMSICKRIMDRHKGTIAVAETSSKGTTFKLCFPNCNVLRT